jgi:glycosyltransferase involved in cell wall biosynthesis
MASARPLIAVTEAQSDLAALVREAGCGAAVEPGNAQQLADVVAAAAGDRQRWEEMGRRGRAHVAEHYSRAAISGQYDALVREVSPR